MKNYTPRHLESHLKELVKKFSVVLLTGARQVGKTTLLEKMKEESKRKIYNYVSLDEFEIRSEAKRDPGLFLQRYSAPLIIDEIQYAPELLPYIKSQVDQKKKMGLYILTGSQQFHLMKNVSESLAGRVAILKLMGLSWAEIRGEKLSKRPWGKKPEIEIPISKRDNEIDLKRVFQRIIQGSFPRLLQKKPPPLDSWYGSYIQTYIDRDLRDFVKASSLRSFEKFIRLCAARTATILNISDLARDSDISVNTAKEWLSLLETSGHIYFLYPYYNNIAKRLIKAPKMHFTDTGLACYLTGWRDPKITANGGYAGQIFETFVFLEILKSYRHRGIEERLFYFRTKEKKEIDLLMENNGTLLPVEIKLASKIDARDIDGIIQLKKTAKNIRHSVVVGMSKTPYSLGPEISVINPIMIR